MSRPAFIACLTFFTVAVTAGCDTAQLSSRDDVTRIDIARLFGPAQEAGTANTLVPDDAPGIPVTLPDNWRSRPGSAPSETVYRMTFPAPSIGRPWVYIARVRTNAEIYLNGAFVWSGGRMSPPLTRHANTPFLFPLPQDLLKPGQNELRVRVAARRGANGGLSQVYVGANEPLAREYSRRMLEQNYSVYITSAIIATTSLYILFIWLETRRRERGYLFAAIAGLIWSARNLNLVWKDESGSTELLQQIVENLTYMGHGWFFGFFGLFLLYELQEIRTRAGRLFARVIVALILACPAVFLIFDSPSPALTILLVSVSPVLACMAWLLVRNALLRRTLGAAVLALLFFVLIALHVYDNLVLVGVLPFDRVYLGHFGGFLFFVAIAQMLVAKYGRVLSDYETLNATLEDRLRLREMELAANYDELSRLARRRTTLEERERIMRDLHDGLGAQLLSAIHDVRRRNVAKEDMEGLLQDCLDELRLAIDSGEPHSQHLDTLLGGLRYRMEQRLSAAGIQLKWNVAELPQKVNLGETGAVHFTRLIQEAITNVIRHSRASELVVTLGFDAEAVHLEIRDNGIGFDAAPARQGHGVSNMQHRAAQLNADLRIETSKRGTAILLNLPINRA